MLHQYSEDLKREIVKMYSSGESVSIIVAKHGIPRSTVYYWLNQYKVINTIKVKSVTAKDYYLLEKKYKKIRTDYQIIIECGEKIDAPRKAKLKIISKLDGKYTVHALCRVLGERRSNYYHYKYRRHIETEVAKRDAELKLVIKQIFEETKGRIGAKRISRLMKEMDLICRSKKKKYHYNFSGDIKYRKNIVNRDFDPAGPNQIWASDITYIYVNYKPHYMCCVIDLFSRKVIAYQVSINQEVALVMDTFKMAMEERKPNGGLIFHSDLGIQYTSYQFRALLRSQGIRQSFSNPGCPYDNAVVESFYRSLKSEEVYLVFYKTFGDMKESIGEYVASFNNIRPHQRLNT